MTVGESPFPVLAGISPSTSSRSPNGVTSASPPERLTRSASHSAARTTSSRCAGSALTDGIAMNSRSSSSQACSTAGESTEERPPRARKPASRQLRVLRDDGGAGLAVRPRQGRRREEQRPRDDDDTGCQGLFLHIADSIQRGGTHGSPRRSGRDVLQLLAVRERPQLLQALVLDLPDPLARDVERPADLVERPRMLPVEPVAQLEHLPLARGEGAEDLPQRLLAQRHLRRLVRKLLVLVREEVSELRLVLVSDRLLERDRRLRAAPDVLDLLDRKVELLADLRGQRLAAELRAQLALGADDLVQLLDHVHGHPDRARLVRERAGDRLPDPPGRVGRELEALAVVELLRRANEPDRPLLDQIEERQALVPVLLRDRHDEAEVRLDHLLLRGVVAALDPLRELDLLRGGEQVDLADVLEEQLQRVGRDLARLFDGRLLLVLLRGDDLDVQLLECVVEVVYLRRIEVE